MTRTSTASTREGGRLDKRAPIAVIVVCLLAWQLFSLSSLARFADMPGPITVFSAWLKLSMSADYWGAIAGTIFSWALGLTLSVIVGVGLGIVIGSFRAATQSTRLLIDFIRTIPAVAIIPLLLLLAGATRTMIIIVVLLAAVWPLLVQTVMGVHQLDSSFAQVARSFRLSRRERLRFIVAPDLLAFVWPALRIAATLSLLVILTAEMFSGAPGIGAEVTQAMNSLRNDVLFAYVVTSGVIGMIINSILMGIQRRLFRWHPSMRKEVA